MMSTTPKQWVFSVQISLMMRAGSINLKNIEAPNPIAAIDAVLSQFSINIDNVSSVQVSRRSMKGEGGIGPMPPPLKEYYAYSALPSSTSAHIDDIGGALGED